MLQLIISKETIKPHGLTSPNSDSNPEFEYLCSAPIPIEKLRAIHANREKAHMEQRLYFMIGSGDIGSHNITVIGQVEDSDSARQQAVKKMKTERLNSAELFVVSANERKMESLGPVQSTSAK